MKKILYLTVLLYAMASGMFLSSCKNKPNDDLTIMDTTTIVIDLDSIVLLPFLPWDSMVEDLDRHMQLNCSDWTVVNPDSLEYDEGANSWKRTFYKGNLWNIYYFEDSKGNRLKFVTFLYYGSMELQPILDEMKRNGFILQGEIRFPNYDSDVCYMYLSPSGALEVQAAGWKDGAWVISFQPTDKEDFKYLVKKEDRNRLGVKE